MMRLFSTLLLLPFFAFSHVDNESNFYKTPTGLKIVEDFKDTYNVDDDFKTDDSQKLQKAIDSISSAGGGKLIIRKGSYSFVEVWLKSNVHIEVEDEVVIRPTNKTSLKNHAIFYLSSKHENPIRNVSFTGTNGVPVIDLRYSENKRVRVFHIRNVHNFLLSDFNILDNHTLFASIEFLPLELNGKLFTPLNGVIKNIKSLNVADYGYGLVQLRTGENLLFKNLSGIGGTTLRLEGHLKSLRSVGGKANMHNIIGRNISCVKGNSAVMLSPHYIFNGHVDVADITALGCGFGVRIDNGFANKEEKLLGLTSGYFAKTSKIKNVNVTFTPSQAQIKPKHFKYIPCELRSSIASEPIIDFPHGDSFNGPTVAAVINTASYEIDFSKDDITSASGLANSLLLITEKDEIKESECSFPKNVDK